MVALNTAYAPSKTRTQPKNRVGNFFGRVGDRAGENRPATRNRIGENGPTLTIIASGRPLWPSRDPIGERGGLNLYGFVYNEPIYHIDILGQAPVIPVILSALKDCAINLALQKLKSSVANATVTQWLKTMCASNNVGSPNHKNITVPKSVFNPSRDMPNYRSAVFSCARNLVTKGVFNTYVNNKFPNVGNIEDKLTQKVLNDINKLTDQTIQKLEDGAKLEWGTAKITTSKNPDNCCSLDWEIEGHVKTGLGNNLSQISIGVLISDTVTASSSSSSLGSACGLCK